MGVLGRVEQFLDAGSARRAAAAPASMASSARSKSSQARDWTSGRRTRVGVALPYFELMFLSGADGAADDLKDIGWSAAMSIFERRPKRR